MKDKIIMNKKLELISDLTDIKIENISVCRYCGEDFALYDIEKNILDKHDFKYPEHCPTCNFRLLNSFLNDKHLYHRKDSKTGKNIISIISEYSDGVIIDVVDYKKFVLDDGGLKYSKELSDDIFGDFIDLFKSFPKPSRFIYPELENSEYSSHVGRAKNVYLSYCVFIECEDIYYSFRVIGGCKDIYSSFNILGSSNVYNSSNLGNSHNIYFSNTAVNSSNLLYCEDMVNCKNCIFSCNQVNSSYLIFNKQYNKEEYNKIKIDIFNKLNNKIKSVELLKQYSDFLAKNLVKGSIDMNRIENTVGEKTYDSKNCVNTYFATGLEDSVNVMTAGDKQDDYMVNIYNSIESGTNCENCIGSCSFGVDVFNLFFSFGVAVNASNIYYSVDIEASEECMFCVGLKSKKYCILNKQYTKDQYFTIKEKLIEKLKLDGLWGESLPFSLSNFPYNDTLAYDYFKVNKVIYSDKSEEIIDKYAVGIVTLKTDDFITDAILDLGGKEKIKIKWRKGNKEVNIPEQSDVINAEDLPNISDTDKSIFSKIIICEESKRPFRIIKKELDFLKKKNLPLPKIHNELRIDKLVGLRPTGEFKTGICDKCNKECLTVFKEKPDYKVYCPECYNNYMYK